MKLSSIIPNSVYSCIASPNEQNINDYQKFLIFNKDFINSFPISVFVINGSKNFQFIELLSKYIKHYEVVTLEKNYGHTFGTISLDNSIHNFCYNMLSDYKYIWKFSIDTLINTKIFDLHVEDRDFYYINNIGVSALSDNNLSNKILSGEYFYPQTNFYIIKNVVQNIFDDNKLIELYNKYTNYLNNGGTNKIWEYIDNFCSEQLLADVVSKNNLSKQMLLKEDNLKQLLNYIKMFNIYDGSHKNIRYPEYLGNLVHYHSNENKGRILTL